MKISTDQHELARGLDTVVDVVPSRSPLPVLSNILLEAKEGQLTLSATDLDISIATRVPASVDEPGKIAVSARKLAEIVRELPRTAVAIGVADSRMTIRCHTGVPRDEAEEGSPEEGVYSLAGVGAEDFPEFPEYQSREGGESEAAGVLVAPGGQDLKEMIGKTRFAVSSDETRPVLGGVFWQIQGSQMKMVATDGHRLSKIVRTLPEEAESAKAAEAIVPPKALDTLVKLISSGCDLKGVTIGENHVIFDLDTTVLFSRVIEGPYPDFEQVIPKNNEKKMVVAKDVLLPAVRRVSILSNSQTHQIRMIWDNDMLELSAVSQEIGGEARESIVTQYKDERFEVGYNANYLLEILRKMESGDVIFELDTPVTSGLIRPAQQPEGEDFLCLIMPLRLEG